MQYETISVRKELMFSNARLASAKGSRPAATLAPLAGDQLEHEWHRPEVHSELDAVRAVLLQGEANIGHLAPARERAFFSVLRTLLCETAVQVGTGPAPVQPCTAAATTPLAPGRSTVTSFALDALARRLESGSLGERPSMAALRGGV
ncbi:MAG: hypothetical protein WDW36_004692 [Sanguina aurantia]